MASLPSLFSKPLDGAVLHVTVSVPSSWSWRLRLGVLLIRAAGWVLGAGIVWEDEE